MIYVSSGWAREFKCNSNGSGVFLSSSWCDGKMRQVLRKFSELPIPKWQMGLAHPHALTIMERLLESTLMVGNIWKWKNF